MSAASTLVFATAYLAAVILPGPGVTALVARVLARGAGGAPAFTAGSILGALAWLAVAATGLTALVARYSALFLAIRYAGAAYLLYLAWTLWTAPVRAMEAIDDSREGHGQLFLAGLAVNLGNPNAVVFFMALLPAVMTLDGMTPADFATLAGLVTLIVAAVYGGYTLVASQARRLFTSPGAMRTIKRGSGIAMAIAAATLLA